LFRCYTFTISETTEKDFRQRSFIEWDFQDKYYAHLDKHETRETELQLMFRTRRESGLLFKAQNAQKSEYLVLEVRKLCAVHHLLFISEKGYDV